MHYTARRLTKQRTTERTRPRQEPTGFYKHTCQENKRRQPASHTMIDIPIWMLLSFACTLSATYLLSKKFLRKRRPGEPPIVSGHPLWGSAIDFSKHAVDFLHGCRRQYGRVFTIRLFHEHLTVIMDPHSVEALSRERRFDFEAIQKQVNMNVFGFRLIDAARMVKDTGRTVRGAGMQRSMDNFVDQLARSCDRVAQAAQDSNNDSNNNNNNDDNKGCWQERGLRDLAAVTIFNALFNSIFGEPDPDDTRPFNSWRVYQNFEVFHKYFTLFWLGMPKRWVPSAMKALGELQAQPSADELLGRHDASDYVKRAVQFMRSQGQTDGDIKAHNLVYLHVNYNSFRLGFWLLDHLLENREAHDAVLREIQTMIAQKVDENNEAMLTLADVEGLPILESVLQETCRLASGVFIVRYITEDTPFTDSHGDTHLMRQGDRVAIYPPAIHKDPEIFEDPLVFKYDRFIDAKFYKDGKEVKTPVLQFGVICPGKRFATLQIKWFLLQIFSRFELRLKDGEHAQYDFRYHGHEVLPPVNDVTVQLRERDSYPTLTFSRL